MPATNPAATGLGTAIIGFDPNKVSVSLSFNNLTSPETAAHIHGPAAAGSNGPIVFTLPDGQFTDFEITLTAQQASDFRGGRFYFDVHTANNPSGEIRGQIPAQHFLIDVLVTGLNNGTITRAQALRLVAEDIDFKQSQLNQAFVLMEYFGYLRRNPDDPPDNNLIGFNFWLNKLNQFNGDFVASEMVKAFIRSNEYRGRFGPP